MPRKLDALAKHCEALGRDRAEIVVTVLANVCMAPSHEEAMTEADAFLALRGIDLASMNDEDAARIRSMMVLG